MQVRSCSSTTLSTLHSVYDCWTALLCLMNTVLLHWPRSKYKKHWKKPPTQTDLFYSFCALSRITLFIFQQVHIPVGNIPLWVKEAKQSQVVFPLSLFPPYPLFLELIYSSLLLSVLNEAKYFPSFLHPPIFFFFFFLFWRGGCFLLLGWGERGGKELRDFFQITRVTYAL